MCGLSNLPGSLKGLPKPIALRAGIPEYIGMTAMGGIGGIDAAIIGCFGPMGIGAATVG
jgi:hypothetical protein